jgi:NADH:ubiquinone oxidoreductase subunit 2 (subunit N)
VIVSVLQSIYQWGLLEWLVIASFVAVFFYFKMLLNAGYRRVEDPVGDAEEESKNQEEWAILSNRFDCRNIHRRM